MSNFSTIAIEYFKDFSSKNIRSLKKHFSEDITLKDWEISAKGINEVIEANKRIFDEVETIEVQPIQIINQGRLIAAQLEITINKTEVIEVVDIFTFNENNQISSIQAYKG